MGLDSLKGASSALFVRRLQKIFFTGQLTPPKASLVRKHPQEHNRCLITHRSCAQREFSPRVKTLLNGYKPTTDLFERSSSQTGRKS